MASVALGDRTAEGRPASSLAFFALPQLALAAIAMPVVIYLPALYADRAGMALGTVGLVFMATRIADMALDPALGLLIDRTRTRLGRFRPWMAASVPVLMLAGWLAFMPPPGAGVGYLLVALMLLYTGYSIAFVGHLSWGAALVPDYAARSRLYGWVQAMTMLGMIAILTLPQFAARWVPGDAQAGLRAIGWFLVVAAPLTILPVVAQFPDAAAGTPERSGERANGVLGDIVALARRWTVARLLAGSVLLALATGITGALFLFFFRARGYAAASANLLLLVYFFGALAGSPVWAAVAARIGKRAALVVSCLFFAVVDPVMLVLPRGDVLAGGIVMFLSGIGYSAALVLLRAMVADACDEARLDLGRDHNAVLYALYTSTAKIGVAAAVGIAFPVLGRLGFSAHAGAANSPAAVRGLILLYVALPLILKLGGAACMIGYRLDARRHAAIRAALARAAPLS